MFEFCKHEKCTTASEYLSLHRVERPDVDTMLMLPALALAQTYKNESHASCIATSSLFIVL
jgi:hypothetical protein